MLLHAAVALRRRSPIGGLLVASVIMLALTAASLPGSPTIAVLLPSSLVYLSSSSRRRRAATRLADAAAIALGLAGAALMTAVAIAHDAADAIVSEPGAIITLAGFLVASIGAAWALGRSRLELRRARASRELAREQAAELRLQREREAAAEERRRLGRDLHDVVSHSLAVMVAQAEASRVLLGRDDARARRRSSTSWRPVAARCRTCAVSSRCSPCRRATASTVPPRWSRVRGSRSCPSSSSGPRRPAARRRSNRPERLVAVSPGTALTVYRVVQESLTNTLKHTEPPTRSEVRLEWGADVLDVTVEDDGGGSGHAPIGRPRAVAASAACGIGRGSSAATSRTARSTAADGAPA